MLCGLQPDTFRTPKDNGDRCKAVVHRLPHRIRLPISATRRYCVRLRRDETADNRRPGRRGKNVRISEDATMQLNAGQAPPISGHVGETDEEILGGRGCGGRTSCGRPYWPARSSVGGIIGSLRVQSDSWEITCISLSLPLLHVLRLYNVLPEREFTCLRVSRHVLYQTTLIVHEYPTTRLAHQEPLKCLHGRRISNSR